MVKTGVKMVLEEVMMPGVEIGKLVTRQMEARGGTRVLDIKVGEGEEVISTLRERKVELEPWKN